MKPLFLCYDRCSTCQKAQKWLDEQQIAYEKRPIKEQNPTAEELAAWQKKSGLPLRKFFNTSGMKYRELNLKDRLPQMEEEEMLSLLATDGMLVKRPLLITPDAVIPGFREEQWKDALRR
ncbi:MAG: arsenate reductase family protein [Clostridia bacterium]|nr:arsenate reductase family protein [Clostridia bacterium]